MAQKKTNKKSPAETNSVRRGIGAMIMLLLAVFSFLGVLGIHAMFIDLLHDMLIHFFGMAAPIFSFSCLFGFLLLIFHRGRPVAFRVCCALFLTLAVAVLCQLFVSEKQYVWDTGLMALVWEDAAQSANGGFLGTLLAMAFTSAFSSVGAVLVWVVLTVGSVFMIFRLSLTHIADLFQQRGEERAERAPRAVPVTSARVTPEQRSDVSAARNSRSGRHAKIRPPRNTYDLPIGGRSRSRVDIPIEEEEEPQAKRKKRGAEETAPIEPPSFGFDEIEADNPVLSKKFRGAHKPPQVLNSDVYYPENHTASGKATALREPVVPEEPEPEPEISSPEPRELANPTGAYQFPALSLLAKGRAVHPTDNAAELKSNATRLLETIQSFGIDARIVSVTRGPSVTRFELELERGVKLSRLTGLSDDIALSLGASGVRIAPIPDKMSVVGIEVPNKRVSTVCIRDVLASDEFSASESKLSIAIGRDIAGKAIVGDLARYTHLLIAGTTGSGKSVCMNSLIVSLLYKATPQEVRLIMIDPKMVELGIYNGIPHLEVPVVTDPKKAAGALQWAVVEMERRYRRFMEHRVRDIFSYNQLVKGVAGEEPMPQMVIIIDELADLMLVAAKEVEESICRLAQKARAAGMHLVIATQRPSVDVITGLMKANIPSRIAFAVASHLESRIILDTGGAEKLVGRGDMLLFPLGAPKPTRVQGCLITGTEVEQVIERIKKESEPQYSQEFIDEIEKNAENIGRKGSSSGFSDSSDDSDPMLDTAIDVVMETGQASTSFLQRRLKLGFARAARIVDQMEDRGIVGPSEGAKPRAILISKQQWSEIKMRAADVMDDAPF